jgi:pilus assembly protein CpaE
MKLESINQGPSLSFPTEQSKLPVIVAGADPDKRDEVCKVLESVTELRLDIINGGNSPAETKEIGPSAILLLILGGDSPMWEQELLSWDERHRVAIIGLLSTHSADAARQALRAGADEVMFLPLDPKDLVPSLVKLSERQGTGRVRRGFTMSFVSAAGGAGSSSLAVALAFALRRLTGKQIVLVDLGLQTSALAALLDIEPEHSIAELTDPTSKIDSIRLESVLCVHESGLRLLAAPKRIEEAELVSASTIASTLTVLRELFDCVVVDCGHHVSEGSVAAWEHSDRVLYILNQSITSVCPARRFCELFDRLQLRGLKLELLLNRYTPANAISIEKIESALHRPVEIRIGRDDKAFSAAEIAAADLAVAAPGSDAAIDIERLAYSLLGQGGDGQALRHGVFNRLLSALRA